MSEALRLEEAVQLGYALAARFAKDSGVRLLAVKGPILSAQNLRDEKQSVDVDVLVHPDDFDRLRHELEGIAWRDLGVNDTPGIVPLHSVTHRHRLWPIEVDVHCWFPGFLADPRLVFEELWARRTSVTVAHIEIEAPDRVAHAAIAALHYLRDFSTGWGQTNLDELAGRIATWKSDDLVDLSELAARTGAAETLSPFLRRVEAPAVGSLTPLVVSIDDWATRAHAETREVLPWLVEFHRRPWRRRPGFVLWSIWLTDRHFRAWSDAPMSKRDVMKARLARIHRAWRALPAARADLARLSPRKGRRS